MPIAIRSVRPTGAQRRFAISNGLTGLRAGWRGLTKKRACSLNGALVFCSVLFLIGPLASPVHAQFVQGSTFTIDGNYTKWGTASSAASGVYVVNDGKNDIASGGNFGSNYARVWTAIGTQSGGSALVSGSNAIQFLYIRVDHKGSQNEATNFNIQLNLGTAAPGRADHLLTLRPTGTSASDKPINAQVRMSLKRYTTSGGAAGYPLVGAFTTSSFAATVYDNNIAGTGGEGFIVQASAGDGAWWSFEAKVPVARYPWVRISPTLETR